MTNNLDVSFYIANCRCLLRVLQKFSIIAVDSPCVVKLKSWSALQFSQPQLVREPNLLLAVHRRKLFFIFIHKCTNMPKQIAKHGYKKIEI